MSLLLLHLMDMVVLAIFFNDMLIPLHELEILYDGEITLPLKKEAEKTFIKR